MRSGGADDGAGEGGNGDEGRRREIHAGSSSGSPNLEWRFNQTLKSVQGFVLDLLFLLLWD